MLAVSLAGTMALIPVPAQADPKPPVIPSQSAVDAAKKAAAAKAAQVGRDRAAARRRERPARAARARRRTRPPRTTTAPCTGCSRRRPRRPRQQSAPPRPRRRWPASASRSAGSRPRRTKVVASRAKLGPLFTADGPQELLDSAGTAHSVSQAMQGSYLRFTATQVVTNAFKVQKHQAVVKVKAASDAAAKAKAAAEAAEAEQRPAVAVDRRSAQQQIAQLATLRNTSYPGRRPAAAGSGGAGPAAGRGAGRQEGRGAAQADRRPGGRRAAPGKPARGSREGSARSAAEPEAERTEEAEAAEKHKPAGGSGNDGGSGRNSRGARAADRLRSLPAGRARTSGPRPVRTRWDCSGLTMGAWKRAGVQLPHYSVAQYEQTKHISEDELRPGDLIFWAENANDPGTIFHVAMYLGGGRMVHAPRTGKPVKIDSVYYWEAPDFFGRP